MSKLEICAFLAQYLAHSRCLALLKEYCCPCMKECARLKLQNLILWLLGLLNIHRLIELVFCPFPAFPNFVDTELMPGTWHCSNVLWEVG